MRDFDESKVSRRRDGRFTNKTHAEGNVDLEPVLDSLNPTGSIHVDYNPAARATAPLADNLVPLSETMGLDPEAQVTIYRGVPRGVQQQIVAGDFITTNRMLAEDYAGTGDVIEEQVSAADILDDQDDPGSQEYLYRPQY